MEKWEYQTVWCEAGDMVDKLTPLGEQGWEAVGFAPVYYKASDVSSSMSVPYVTQWSAREYRVLLKRRKP